MTIKKDLHLRIKTQDLTNNILEVLEGSEWKIGEISYPYKRNHTWIEIKEGTTVYDAVNTLAEYYFADFLFNEDEKTLDFIFNKETKDKMSTPHPEIMKLQNRTKTYKLEDFATEKDKEIYKKAQELNISDEDLFK